MTGISPHVAGVEMGGTKCILTLSRGPNDHGDRAVVPTTDPATTLAAIEAQLDRWKDKARFAAIGIAGFGPLQLDPRQPDFGAIIATPKPGWSGINAYARIAERYAVPIALQTDVNGAALAEGRWGGAQGMESHAYITVGTGVGVGLIVGGRPLVGLTHSEMGHIRLNRAQGDHWPGSCPFHGDCVEGLIAGPAIAARLGRPGHTVPDDDPSWALFDHSLTQLLHTLVLTFAPERIAIGGGVVESRAGLFDRLRQKLAASLNGYGAAVRFVGDVDTRLGPPALGAMAGPLGPIALALDVLERGSS